ncbi:MAG: 5-methyltetrahydropteroyltriglutamate--homocysteine S-methyltransferase [Alphaproteobacteria bacterium]|jgi:5-methyltetrahydropteroyltriglutamate--homocysteine methyltransferase
MTDQKPIDPPFRAEHIGSLLRPQDLIDARLSHEGGDMEEEELRELEDLSIRDAVRQQEDIGLEVITDGEFRRNTYFSHFFERIGGLEFDRNGEKGWDYTNDAGETVGAARVRIASRLHWTRPINDEDFTFVDELTSQTVKVTLPGPCVLHFFGGAGNISKVVYDDLDLFWDDIVDAYINELAALDDAGCEYVQLDETALAKFSDPKIQAALEARGDNWQDLLKLYASVINRVLADKPADMRIGMHLCRGNKQSYWQAEGSYDLVADTLFNEVNADCYFLEYDTSRAGDFSPLKYLPKNKTAILGLVSTKTPELESKDDLKKRIDEAAAMADLDNLALSPQCGFASDHHGNQLSLDDQIAKLRLVVETAAEIWPK